MKRFSLYGLVAVFAVMFIFSGCARSTKKDVRALQAQMGVVGDELYRLDQSLQETRSAIQAEQERKQQLQSQLGASTSRLSSLEQEEGVLRSIYRTPSGFELPSAQIQQALKNAGYYQGPIDGKIGPGTREAIKKFQADQGLTADGIVGRKTWEKLKSYLNIK